MNEKMGVLKQDYLPGDMAPLLAAARAWYAATPKGSNKGEKPKVEGEEKSEVDAMLKQLGYVE